MLPLTVLSGIPNELPAHLAMLEDIKDRFNLPLPLQLRLAGKTVNASSVLRIFNSYYSQLQALSAILLRDKFFVRVKVQRAGDNALIYSASENPWKAPQQLFETNKPIGAALRFLEQSSHGQRIIDTPLALHHILQHKDNLPAEAIGVYMRQAPHDWYLDWDFGKPIEGVSISKSGNGSKVQKFKGSRLVGATAYKGVLDKMLSNPESVSIGDFGIIFDQYFDQKNTYLQNGKLEIEIKPSELKVNLALPVQEAVSEKTPLEFETYIGIDLGERGLGYAVFDANTHQMLDKGRVKVRSMTRLVKDDLIGKRKESKVRKFNAKFDRAEENRRENVVGDFCQAINRLMWYYKGFPVLEFAAGGASKAVDKVYAMVAEHYLYSTTPTTDAVRKSYWMGASYWQHREYKQFKFDAATGKRGKTVGPLNLFPGAGVSAYGTSQTCSCCGRNAIEAIKAMQAENKEKKDIEFKVHADGSVSLKDGEIAVYFSASEDDRMKAKRKNERAPLVTPISRPSILGDDLIRAVRRNLRQAPKSMQTKDTTISVYNCVYQDCGKIMHADENAAINIGVKFTMQLAA